MFDGGLPEQIHRFIASSPAPPPLPPHQPAAERSIPFPLSCSSFNTNHLETHHMLSLGSRKIIHHHHHYHHHHEIKDGISTVEGIDHTDHDGYNHHHHHPWCSDEVLALLRFRSTMENWFPEFTWEHTSRKLAEIGFKRSPQECKEKFEEEERKYFNTNDHHQINNYNNGSNYKIFSEVEEFYNHGNDDEHVSSEVGDNQNKIKNNSLERQGNIEEIRQDLVEKDKGDHNQVEEESMENNINSIDDYAKSSSRDKKKRKREKDKERFVVLKGFCKSLVRKMIAQQEEMYKKVLEDMVKKEEDKILREEAWKKQEIERVKKEVEIRTQEQDMASYRNTKIIKFISNFTDQSQNPFQDSKLQTLSLPQHNPLVFLQTTLEPISTKTLKTKTHNPKSPRSDLGKRWHRNEVLALINTRSNISSMNDDDDDHKDVISSLSSLSSSKSVPLWERISKKMMEIGYQRSAKRCKEKWENINKYFKKTKDVNKKRTLDSRTCPYFHQLTALYSQPSTGTTITRPDENRVESKDPDDIQPP